MEEWKDVEGYEGLYQVSSEGSVRSVERYVNHAYGKRIVKGKTLTPHLLPNGYYSVGLSKDNKTKDFYIHRLVATAFVPNNDLLMQVNHKDENKANNRADNLEWCTHEYNMEYGTRRERFRESRGTAVQMLSNGVVVGEFVSMRHAETETGLRRKSISACCRGTIDSYHGYEFRYKDGD